MTDQTAKYWDAFNAQDEPPRSHALAHPFMQAHVRDLWGGLNLEDWLIKNHLQHGPVQRGIGIGAGAAIFELLLVQSGFVEEYVLYDVSQVALDAARERARQYGVEARVQFICQDINRVTLPENHYDLVTFISSLHHMSNLEGILRQVHATLVPGGILFADEYIGPDRFNFPEEHTLLARQLYRVLDAALQGPWPELSLPDPKAVEAADPTEAVHASEIVATVKRVFPRVKITAMQNTLPFIIWPGLNHDALFETAKGNDFVRSIIDIDDAMIRAGKYPSYFALIVAHKSLSLVQEKDAGRSARMRKRPLWQRLTRR